MSVILTTHFAPGYDENNPEANNNLFVTVQGDSSPIVAPVKLVENAQYLLHVNVRNEGDSDEKWAQVKFSISENGDLENQVGEPVSFEINASETKTLESTTTFTVVNGNDYDLIAVVQGRNDPYSGEPNADNRHVAWQTASVGEKDVQLTLQDGLGQGSGSIGQNPNVYIVDENGHEVTKPKQGSSYTIMARVVNNGADTDEVQVQFYSKKSGKDAPIGLSEIADVVGNGGEYVFSQQGWVYEHGQNELMAVCSTISDADQYTNKNIVPSDRHVGQFNVN